MNESDGRHSGLEVPEHFTSGNRRGPQYFVRYSGVTGLKAGFNAPGYRVVSVAGRTEAGWSIGSIHIAPCKAQKGGNMKVN